MIRGLGKQGVLLFPSAAVFFLIFVAPISYFFVLSFWRVRTYQLRVDATLHNYEKVFTQYDTPLLFTFGIALAIGVLVTVLAFCFSYVVRFKAGRYGTTLLFVALVTMFGGYLTKIYVWKTILGNSGILNSGLMWLGVIDEPITAFLFNPVAVIITLTHYTLPLAILPIYGSLRAIEELPLRAARDLGAGRWRVFWDLVMPQCRVGLTVAFTLTFLFAAGDYVTPRLVGGPFTSMIGVFIEQQFGARLNQPLGAAMAFSVITICILVVTLISFALKHLLKLR